MRTVRKLSVFVDVVNGKNFTVISEHIKGALRMMKKLIMNGKKEEAEDMSSDEAEASPLIRWLKVRENCFYRKVGC